MKKYISIIIAVLLCAASFAGCSSQNGTEKDRLSVVTTIFPVYDWAKNVLGEREADLTMLLDTGVDLHSFQPSADDIIKISTCDLFIYVGGESDEWVADALGEASNKDMVVINLLDALGDGAKEEELLEGMEAEENHDHGEEGEEDHDHGEEEHEYDEHVWLSLKNAALLTEKLRDALIKADPDGADSYTANAAAYTAKLNDLDKRYADTVAAAPVKTLVFGDRFPFAYLADDYSIECFAAFAGCSAESEASFETVSFLAKKVDELHLSAVMTLEGTDHRLAETVVSATGAKNARILSLDSMQSATAKDVKDGMTYLSVMEKNLTVLADALK